MKYKTYLKKMKRSGEWGDHVTLQAAADQFGAKICLLTSFKDSCLIKIFPKDQNPSRGSDYWRRLLLTYTTGYIAPLLLLFICLGALRIKVEAHHWIGRCVVT
ncbi:hypothetical protein Syun_029248 [Stephania yunnanensis]|uniref:Uncharacterized protein n=1 Tax=Stephania yunnanensis TaxID=152371 RepID=A0AAP0E586_9MAGN